MNNIKIKLNLNESILSINLFLDPQGWWTGMHKNKTGLFPSNYIEKI
jgi:hypothetical protein